MFGRMKLGGARRNILHFSFACVSLGVVTHYSFWDLLRFDTDAFALWGTAHTARFGEEKRNPLSSEPVAVNNYAGTDVQACSLIVELFMP